MVFSKVISSISRKSKYGILCSLAWSFTKSGIFPPNRVLSGVKCLKRSVIFKESFWSVEKMVLPSFVKGTGHRRTLLAFMASSRERLSLPKSADVTVGNPCCFNMRPR